MENLNRSGSYSHSSFVGAHDVLMYQIFRVINFLENHSALVKIW